MMTVNVALNTAFIITVTVALILYGCYVMKKLDAFSSQDKSEPQKDLLRLAVQYTGMENAIKSELEELALQNPDYHLLIFGGTKQNILELLKRGEADIALLSGINRCSSFHCFVKEYQENPTEQLDDVSAQSMSTVQEVTIVWNHTGNNEILSAFIALLPDGNG